jgi:5-formyltetrahydrofolate cyclo-ligase
MSENTRRAKALMRRVLRDRRRSSGQGSVRSALDIEKWPQKWQDKVKTARYVAAYMPIDEELHLDDLLRPLPVKTCFPRVEGDDIVFYEAKDSGSFKSGSFSILEPEADLPKVDPSLIDVILVPGMAYDVSGTRLGRGKGYYDRFCGSLERRPVCIGVVAEKNVFSALPKDPWDLSVDALLTETSFTEVSKINGNEVEK